MQIIVTATVREKKTQNYKEIEYGYIHNGGINDFDYDSAIKSFCDSLAAEGNYSYIRVTDVDIELGYTYPVIENN